MIFSSSKAVIVQKQVNISSTLSLSLLLNMVFGQWWWWEGLLSDLLLKFVHLWVWAIPETVRELEKPASSTAVRRRRRNKPTEDYNSFLEAGFKFLSTSGWWSSGSPPSTWSQVRYSVMISSNRTAGAVLYYGLFLCWNYSLSVLQLCLYCWSVRVQRTQWASRSVRCFCSGPQAQRAALMWLSTLEEVSFYSPICSGM